MSTRISWTGQEAWRVERKGALVSARSLELELASAYPRRHMDSFLTEAAIFRLVLLININAPCRPLWTWLCGLLPEKRVCMNSIAAAMSVSRKIIFRQFHDPLMVKPKWTFNFLLLLTRTLPILLRLCPLHQLAVRRSRSRWKLASTTNRQTGSIHLLILAPLHNRSDLQRRLPASSSA